ncbi:hypothetical protein COCOBI_07-4820 [Coccomyxa sp. Obi]|nr:hypothetical protein COCOBI_07-4820 [Coccomyxa sp. Obi]
MPNEAWRGSTSPGIAGPDSSCPGASLWMRGLTDSTAPLSLLLPRTRPLGKASGMWSIQWSCLLRFRG